jgi:uncharacterized protein with PIN domain
MSSDKKPMDQKSAQVVDAIESIFPGTKDAVSHNKCPLCKSPIDKTKDFKDALSLREYYISGMCQKCQNSIWG